MNKTSSHRRRSSFRSRLSLHKDDLFNETTNGTNGMDDISTTTASEERGEKDEDLVQYIAKIKKEEKDWKALRQKLQIQSRELEDKPADVLNVKEGWALLNKEDKQFLNERLDYAEIWLALDASSKAIAKHQTYAKHVIGKGMNLIQNCNKCSTEVATKFIHHTTHSPSELEQIEVTSTESNVISEERSQEFCQLTDKEKATFFDLNFDCTSDTD